MNADPDEIDRRDALRLTGGVVAASVAGLAGCTDNGGESVSEGNNGDSPNQGQGEGGNNSTGQSGTAEEDEGLMGNDSGPTGNRSGNASANGTIPDSQRLNNTGGTENGTVSDDTTRANGTVSDDASGGSNGSTSDGGSP